MGMIVHPPELYPDEQINQDVLRPVFVTTWRWWILVAISGGGFMAGLATWFYMMATGMWVTGLHRPVMWGLLISNYVFWIGLSNSGTVISAMLRLSKADWRRPITRAAEAMTVFALLIAAQFPLIHLGRTWLFYYILPYVNQRLLWNNFRSPLVWDMMAIMAYLGGSMLYLYLPTLPDFAILRDHADGIKKKMFTLFALGWRGTRGEWTTLNACILSLALLVLPVAVSMHTIVSWDFGMTLVPLWHTSIFGPYFVIGALYSGMALVITIILILRWAFGWQRYITPYHLDKLGKIMLVAGLVWFYLWFNDYVTSWYGKLPEEKIIFDLKNAGTYYWWQITMMLANTMVTLPLLAFKKFRTSPLAMFILTIFINIGMWIERLLIVVPSLVEKGPSFTWTTYHPTWVEWMLTVYPLAGFMVLYLLFIKIAPLISVWEIREDKVAYATKKMGQAELRAVVAE